MAVAHGGLLEETTTVRQTDLLSLRSLGQRTSSLVAPNGTIIPINSSGQLTAIEIVKHTQAALLEPYDGSNPDHFGKPKIEAALSSIASKAQDGSIEATNALLDRLIGKPVQQNNNVNVTASLKDFLDEINQKEQTDVQDTVRPIIERPSSDIDPFS